MLIGFGFVCFAGVRQFDGVFFFGFQTQFSSGFPNGGAARPPTESLVLDGETLISITFPGGANLRIAETSSRHDTVWSQTTTSGNTRTTLSVKSLKVSREDASGTRTSCFQ